MSISVHSLPRSPTQRPRGPLRRYLETSGVIGDHEAPHVETRLRAHDGTLLAGTYLPGPSPDAPAVLLLHGFAANRKKPAYAYLADVLSHYAHVLALDFRGHGDSDGWTTLGDREALDVEAGVRWLRAYGHDRIVPLGMSMGGTALYHAASRGLDVDGLVTVSAPAWLHATPQTDAMKDLHDVWFSPLKRNGMRVFIGVRMVRPRDWHAPIQPVEAVASTTLPLLVAHGEDDPYFPISDAKELVRAAGGPAVLWSEPAGFGHAEDGVSATFAVALGEAIETMERDGRFPERAAVEVS